MNIILFLLINYLGFTIGPARVEKALFGAEEITEVFEVQNFSGDSLRIKIEFEDFDVDEYGKVTWFTAGHMTNSAGPHTVINPEEFVIRPQGVEFVRLTFRPPTELTLSEYYGMLLFKSQPIPTQYKPTITVAGEIGVPIYYSVASLIVKDAAFDSLDIIGDSIRMVFRNVSNVHLRVKGEAKILSYDGTLISKDSLPEFVVLPNKVRKFTMPMRQTLEKGTYIVRVLLDYGALELIEGERIFKK